MQCPKCRSEETKQTNANYPNSYECFDCGHTWIKPPQALIDE